MSIDAARTFHAKMQADNAFRTAVTNATTPDAVRAIAAEAGIGEFTVAELESVAAELSDQDLGKVSGGWGDPHVIRNLGSIKANFGR